METIIISIQEGGATTTITVAGIVLDERQAAYEPKPYGLGRWDAAKAHLALKPDVITDELRRFASAGACLVTVQWAGHMRCFRDAEIALRRNHLVGEFVQVAGMPA